MRSEEGGLFALSGGEEARVVPPGKLRGLGAKHSWGWKGASIGGWVGGGANGAVGGAGILAGCCNITARGEITGWWPMKPTEETGQLNLPANTQNHLAWLRTRLSVERNLDAWIRTSVALIGFGFTIVLFFDQFNRIQDVTAPKSPSLARYAGLLLIGIGTLALIIAVWQDAQLVRYLRSDAFRGIAGVPGMRRLYASLTVAVLLCLVGLLAFFAILVRAVLP